MHRIAIAFLLAACSPVVDELDDAPELDSECPGGLLCECSSDDECEGYGLAGARGRCSEQGLCTVACSDAAPCDDVLPDIACGRVDLSQPAPECVLPCDLPIGDPCDVLGLPATACSSDGVCAAN